MIKLITIEHQDPHLIETQYRSFEKNMREDFEFILIDNAKIIHDHESSYRLSKLAEKFPIKHVTVELDSNLVNEFDNAEDSINRGFRVFSGKKYMTASIANSYALQWTQKYVINSISGAICLMHSDMFMIKPENLSSYLTTADVIYYPQGPSSSIYAWPSLFLIGADSPGRNSINWWCGSIGGNPVDCGGMTYYFLSQTENLRTNILSYSYIQDDPTLDFHPSDYEIIGFSPSSPKSILHYRSASNWNNRESKYHTSKRNWVEQLIENN